MCLVRFAMYDVKIMLRQHDDMKRKYSVIHYAMDLPANTHNDVDVVAIVVPILSAKSEKEVKSKIEILKADNKNVEIYIFAIFSEMEIMTDIHKFRDDLVILNNVCLKELVSLTDLLQDNCRTRYLNFNKDSFLVDEILSVCKKEIQKRIQEEQE